VYGSEHLTRAAEIMIGKEAGFSLDQLRELFCAPDRDSWREVIRAQLARVRERMDQLALSRKLLEHGLLHVLAGSGSGWGRVSDVEVEQ
jgi:MerR family copper efflux transcriptional regulator